MKDMRVKRVKLKSQVLVISECCPPAMFGKKILREQTAATAELITSIYVSLMPNRSQFENVKL